jgi:hypothetical protein
MKDQMYYYKNTKLYLDSKKDKKNHLPIKR